MEYERSEAYPVLKHEFFWHGNEVKAHHALIIGFILLTDLFIFFDVYFLRQIFVFLFLWILPGMLVLSALLRIEAASLTEKFLLSVGLSCSSVIFIGLITNSLYPLLIGSRPLSTYPLMIALNAFMFLLIAVCYMNGRDPILFSLHELRSGPLEKLLLVLPAGFFMMSILGTWLMNSRGMNHILMFLLFSIAAYVLFMGLFHRHVPERVYPPAIFLISISVILVLALRSNHLIGSDVHSEYYLFLRAIKEGLWHITPGDDMVLGLLDSCLSISILPAVYQIGMNINPEYLFKVNNGLIFAVSPLAVYVISRKYLDGFYAFLAAFFFMSQLVFIMTAYNPRTTIAVMFFSLAILVIMDNGIDGHIKRFLFLVFSFSCILSHYTTSYIFLFILAFDLILMSSRTGVLASLGRIYSLRKRNGLQDYGPIHKAGFFVNYRLILILFAMIFLWHGQITGEPFRSAVNFFSTIIESLSNLFIVESRGDGIALAFGLGLDIKQIPLLISFVSSWMTVCFLSIGLLYAMINYAGYCLRPNGEYGLSGRKLNLNPEFLAIAIICYAIILASVVLPYVAKGYGMDRIYFQMSVILSTFFIIGGKAVADKIHIKNSYLLILVVIIPYFLCNSGAMYQAFGNDKMVTLSSEGKMHDELYVTDHETFCAKWLKSRAEERSNIYADFYGTNRLISQGEITSAIYMKEFIEEDTPPDKGYIYFRYCGAALGKLLDRKGKWHDVKDYDSYLDRTDLLYSNGGSKILM